MIPLLHVACPDPARRAQLRDFLEEVVVDVPEERQARREGIHVQATCEPPFYVREPVGERERELLRRGGPRFADVVARDRDRVPQWGVLCAPLEHVHDDLERGLDWIYPGVLGHVLLEDVVLHGAAQLVRRDTLLLGRGDVKAEEHRGRAVDGHGRRDPIERDAAEQVLHVGKGGDGHAALPHLPFRARMIGVVAHQGRKVERHRQAGLPVLEEEFVPLVSVFGAPEARELAHGPEPSAVHGRVDTARERVLARFAERAARVEAGQVVRRVDGLSLASAHFTTPVFT